MHIDAIRNLVIPELNAVDALIDEQLNSDIELIGKVSRHLIKSGGKRLRPLLLLLCAKSFNYTGKSNIPLAAALEFVHTATLLHDDVVDDSKLRRGNTTANTVWGNQASILIGDFLYSRAFQLMVDVKNIEILTIIATATNILSHGEVMQLIHIKDPETSENRYMEIIRNKTATLFAVAAEVGAILGKANASQQQCLQAYGLHLGTAFQLVDDALDYESDSDTIGKNIGDDLSEGKVTLPLIHILMHGTQKQKQLVRNAITQGGLDNIDDIIHAIKMTGAIEYTYDLAHNEVQKALQSLALIPASPYRDALLSLAEFTVHRKH